MADGNFYSRPCGRGDHEDNDYPTVRTPDFYSRPCGRGDKGNSNEANAVTAFLLTPLREGRPVVPRWAWGVTMISTHAPAGGATRPQTLWRFRLCLFLLTPLREGRPGNVRSTFSGSLYFYSRPCGRGDSQPDPRQKRRQHFYSRPCGRGDRLRSTAPRRSPDFYSRPCGRGDQSRFKKGRICYISTHAPAGGATHADFLRHRTE